VERRLGKVVGKVHALARGYTPQYRLADWQHSGSYFTSPAELDGELSWMAVRRAGIIGYLNTLPRERDSYGLIHADLHFGNFFVDAANPAITLFDFDDCAYGWYVMDIAMLLFDAMVLYTGADRDRFAASFMASLLRGYVTENSVSAFWLSQIPHLLKLLEIGVYADVCADYDPQDTQSWVGKFMPGRKQSIAADAPYVHLDWASLLPAS
jgi:Ser/Thr protein kinase RdoA (MazF antagonist)